MSVEQPQPAGPASREPDRSLRWKLLGVGLMVAGFWTLFVLYQDELNFAALERHEAALRSRVEQHPWSTYAAATAIYTVVTALSLPGATLMTLACGWLFGFWHAVAIVSIASTTGATLAFLLARFLFHDAVQRRFGDRLAGFNEALRREGAFYLFTLRLTPAVPYFVVNVVMALTPIRTWTYWWVSQVGMLPVTAAFVWAGASVPTAKELAERGTSGILTTQMIAALVVIGFLPLVANRIIRRWRARPAAR